MSPGLSAPFFTRIVAVDRSRLNANTLRPGDETPASCMPWSTDARSFGTLRGGLRRSHTVIERKPPGARHLM